MFLSVVLSFYNEEETIPELLRRLREVLRPLCGDRYELVFVDDDSTDRSLAMLRDEASRNGDIRVVVMSRNVGPSVCAIEGIRHAKGDAVIYMDSDLQDPPELIPRMVDAWRDGDGADVVHTVREARMGESAFKLWVTRVGYRVLRAVSSVDIIPEAGDFKLLSRRAADEIGRTGERRPFPRGLSTWVGLRQAIVPYRREARTTGRTKCPVLGVRVINYFLDTALVSFSDLPLKLSLFLGIPVSIAGTAMLAAFLGAPVFGKSLPDGSGLLAAVLLLGGLQFVAIGLLGLYVNAIHAEVRRRPPFVIRETIGFPDAR